MYEENNVTYKVGINWKDVIVKIILLILFVLLLYWLFPKADLDVFYDSVYTNNINTMKDAARNYYTADKLPSAVGEQTSMSLKEMVDNHLIIRFTDKDEKTCDETNSKVEITKISDNEHTMKVQLNCGSQEDYILETISTSTLCSDGKCTVVINNSNNSVNGASSANGNSNGSSNANGSSNNGSSVNGATANNNGSTTNSGTGSTTTSDSGVERDDTDYSGYDVKDGIYRTKVTYYQHRKAITSTSTVYTCPSGYTKTGSGANTKCYKSTNGAVIAATPHYSPDQVITTDAKLSDGGTKVVYTDPIKTKTGTEYSCPTGYTLNGSYCVKYTDATAKEGQTTYTCPSGYTKNGTKCTKTYTATYKPGATSYSCPNGGTLSGKTCTLTANPSSSTSYSCPSGYTKNGTSCYKVQNATSSTTYSCPSGYTKSGSGSSTKCSKTTTSSYNATATKYVSSYSCPSGYSKSGTTCKKTTTINATSHTGYNSWVNQGTRYYTSSAKAYTGSTSKLVYVARVTGAACGSACGNTGIWYKYTYYTRSTYTYYTCPSGYSKSGSKCSTTSTKSATANYSTKYSCPNGGSLSGTKCNKSTTTTAKPSSSTTYSCPSGYTKSGSGSSTKCTYTIKATATTTYTCPSGYTKSGSGSSTKCTKTYNATGKEGTGSYVCNSGDTLSGTTCTNTINATEHKGQTVYTCPSGYTLTADNRCEAKTPATPNDIYSYSCPAGYMTKGTGANTQCYKEEKITGYYCEDSQATLTSDNKCVKTVKGSIINYTCPSGYTLSGTKCTKKSSITISATKNVKTKTSYKYKWSKSSYIDGWTFTGKTKTAYETYTAGQK